MAARTLAGALLLLSVVQTLAQPFILPPLNYPYDALEPVIDNQTMHFHHDTHHSTYVNNTNAAVATNATLVNMTISQILLTLRNNTLPSALETKLMNQAGGHWNHAFFWKILAAPNSSDTSTSAISPKFLRAIDANFGNVTALKAELAQKAKDHFGSGWSWLVLTGNKRQLKVVDTNNQDNPIAKFEKRPVQIPILGIDVWEHGYYLKYGPSKAKYADAIVNIFNWTQASLNYENALVNNLDAISVKF